MSTHSLQFTSDQAYGVDLVDNAWIGLVGAVIGALVTGIAQGAIARASRKHERWKVRRQERRSVYIEALWQVRRLPDNFRQNLIAEHEAREAGEDFDVPDSSDHLEMVERTTFELRLLGRSDIADMVESYRDDFVEWVMNQDPEAPISGFDALKRDLDNREAQIIDSMRDDLE